MVASSMSKSFCQFALFLVALSGCHYSTSTVTAAVLARAPGDLSCAQNAIQLSRLSKANYRAEGCGSQATYVCTCKTGGPANCWTMSCQVDVLKLARGTEVSPAVEPAASAGCQYDIQCKGNRVCQAG